MATNSKRNTLMRNAAAGALAAAMFATPSQAIVPNDNFTPADIIDDTGVNGVGMFFRNDGFVCTGTLINPRTVLFAAHCVNSNPESDFAEGNLRSAFSFDDNALPGFLNWINGDDGNGFTQFQSHPDMFVYNISQIYYDPRSLADPNAFGFLEADIAIAALDDPAQNIPTWALLFSPLPTPDAITDEDGTGYHVNITGYGRSGSGTTGASQGIDWRRRAAENMLGALTSFDDRNNFLFGQPFGDLPQVLYRLDFDDPNKTNPFDFNLYKDEPREREATTAGGDSGGPLVLDAANNNLADEDLVIGVLSGGSRFFGPQVFSSYGTESFYQPLFPYWDYIVATNPYRYVSAIAGDGDWDDPTHWQTDLDPAYRIIDADGNVVNGIPTTIGGGTEQDTPQFGEVCFDPEGDNPGDGCQDLATGDPTPPSRPAPAPAPTPTPTAGVDLNSGIGAAELPNATSVSELASGGNEAAADTAAEVSAPVQVAAAASAPGVRAGMIMGSENQAQNGNGMLLGGENIAHNGVELAEQQPQNGVDLAEEQPQASDGGEPEFTDTPNPAPTLANGLPGATNFVPDNVDSDIDGPLPDRRYFEVTLNQTGTTTLSSDRTIDRLNVGGDAGLMINASGILTMENDVNQTGGRIAVDGALNSANDYSLFAGVLSGNGTVTAPFLTNIAGAIAPGTMGGIGTLDIDGNVVLSSGSMLLIDVGPNGTSDLLRVNAQLVPELDANGNPVLDMDGNPVLVRDTSGDTGNINLGGDVVFATTAFDRSSQNSVRYRIVEATRQRNGIDEDPVTGTFNPLSVSGVLTAEFIYGSFWADAVLTVNSYQSVVNSDSAVQVSYAALLDQNRGNGFGELFDTLDFLSASAVQSTLESWAPTTESAVQNMARSSLNDAGRFYSNRMRDASRSASGGTVAVIGRPIELAAASTSGIQMPGSPAVMNDSATSAAATQVTEGGINEDMAVYLAGGFIEGNARPMPRLAGGPNNVDQDEFDGFFIAGGLEYFLSEDDMLGISVYYSDVDASVALNQQAEGRTLMASIYGQSSIMGLDLDARISAGSYNAQTRRNVALGAQAFTLTTDDDSFFFASEIGLSKRLNAKGGFTIAPGIGARATKINFDTVQEAGGGPALTIVRPDYESLQGLVGVEFETSANKPLQLRASGHYVHEFLDQTMQFGANFVGGQGIAAPFALANPDRDWGEFGVGLRYNTGNVSFDLMADTTVGRGDVESQVYSASATFRF